MVQETEEERIAREEREEAEFEAAKLVICVGVYLSIVLAYVFSLRVRRGPLVVTWACGGACGHLHPRRARYRPVAYESDEEETAPEEKSRPI